MSLKYDLGAKAELLGCALAQTTVTFESQVRERERARERDRQTYR